VGSDDGFQINLRPGVHLLEHRQEGFARELVKAGKLRSVLQKKLIEYIEPGFCVWCIGWGPG
jgi:hypothetical protein